MKDLYAALSKMFWATPIANSAALLGLLQLVGNVDDPDYALHALYPSIKLFGTGAVLGLIAIIVEQGSFIARAAIERSEASRLEAKERGDKGGAIGALEQQIKQLRDLQIHTMATLTISGAGLVCLVLGGNLLISDIGDGKRIQPPKTSAPSQTTAPSAISKPPTPDAPKVPM